VRRTRRGRWCRVSKYPSFGGSGSQCCFYILYVSSLPFSVLSTYMLYRELLVIALHSDNIHLIGRKPPKTVSRPTTNYDCVRELSFSPARSRASLSACLTASASRPLDFRGFLLLSYGFTRRRPRPPVR
jgi:hypothetical protein